MHADDDDAEADLDASRKSHLFKIKLVAPRNSIETQLREEKNNKKKAFSKLKRTRTFSCTEKNISFFFI